MKQAKERDDMGRQLHGLWIAIVVAYGVLANRVLSENTIVGIPRRFYPLQRISGI